MDSKENDLQLQIIELTSKLEKTEGSFKAASLMVGLLAGMVIGDSKIPGDSITPEFVTEALKRVLSSYGKGKYYDA